ncbi:MAG TPA: ethylbenzene dehydrogenase-related protein [Anaeromyxobacteraceae bacterium]|nr:ethylbenzene dehydrogenase-related protein [Anaeromyxobacteraceae bacterium]
MATPIRFALPAAVGIAALGLAAAGCSSSSQRPVSPAEVRAVKAAALPSDPADPAWGRMPVHTAQLLPQDVVEPRLLAPSTAALEVQAITDGTSLAFRLAWPAAARSDEVLPALFSDACAVQLPAGAGADVPNPMMGEAGQPVEISYWRAAWQATVDGRPDTLAALYPNSRVDAYPFESASLAAGSPEQAAMAKRYAPARALGNAMAGPRTSPVQDLVATGPGTLRPAERSISSGGGKATPQGWAVVIVRPLPRGARPGGRSQVAFAVWQGQRGEVGARKMRTGWIPLALEGGP